MNNKLSMMKLAKHIIAIAQEYNLSISNLKLQKILYFIIKDIKNCSENWNFNLTEIYNEKFELWSFGLQSHQFINTFPDLEAVRSLNILTNIIENQNLIY